MARFSRLQRFGGRLLMRILCGLPAYTLPGLSIDRAGDLLRVRTSKESACRRGLASLLNCAFHLRRIPCLRKSLSADGLDVDLLWTRKYRRTCLRFPDDLWLVWHGVLPGARMRPGQVSVPVTFSKDLLLDMGEKDNSIGDGGYRCAFDVALSPCISAETPYAHPGGEDASIESVDLRYRRYHRGPFDFFWMIRTSQGTAPAANMSLLYETSRASGVKLVLTDRSYLVFAAERPRKTPFPGCERIPEKAVLVVMKFIDEELDVLWAVEENEIRRYG